MARRKFESNIQFVTRVMDHSKYGALKQAFIMDALDKAAEAIAKIDPDTLASEFSMVNPRAWIGCAKELQAELKEHFQPYPIDELALAKERHNDEGA